MLASGFDENALFADTDSALEACENALLNEVLGQNWRLPEPVPLAACTLFQECDEDDLQLLDQHMTDRTFAAGETIVESGSRADELFVLLAGAVEVSLPAEGGRKRQRLDVLSASMSFGEMAFIDDAPRSADVIALEQSTCRVLKRETLTLLETLRPGLKSKLLIQLVRQLSSRLRTANREASALRG